MCVCVYTLYWVNAYVISFAWNFIGNSKISPIAGGERPHQFLIHKDKQQQHELHKINTTTTTAASVVNGICVYRCLCVCVKPDLGNWLRSLSFKLRKFCWFRVEIDTVIRTYCKYQPLSGKRYKVLSLFQSSSCI